MPVGWHSKSKQTHKTTDIPQRPASYGDNWSIGKDHWQIVLHCMLSRSVMKPSGCSSSISYGSAWVLHPEPLPHVEKLIEWQLEPNIIIHTWYITHYGWTLCSHYCRQYGKSRKPSHGIAANNACFLVHTLSFYHLLSVQLITVKSTTSLYHTSSLSIMGHKFFQVILCACLRWICRPLNHHVYLWYYCWGGWAGKWFLATNQLTNWNFCPKLDCVFCTMFVCVLLCCPIQAQQMDCSGLP